MYSSEQKVSISYNDSTINHNDISVMKHQINTDKIFTNHTDYEIVKILADDGERTVMRNVKKNSQLKIDAYFNNFDKYQVLTKLCDDGEMLVVEKIKKSNSQSNVDKLFSNFGNYTIIKALSDDGEKVIVKNKKFIKQKKIDNIFELSSVSF